MFLDSNTDGVIDNTLHYANDANMNVTALLDAATWSVVERYHYDPYGTPLIFDGAWVTQVATAYGNMYLFTGRYYEPETGLYYYRARFYDPTLGRFASKDPIGYDGSKWNLYAYVGNNPTLGLDPFGLADLSDGSYLVVESATGAIYNTPAPSVEGVTETAATAIGMTEGFENKWAELHEIRETLRTASSDDVVVYLGHKFEKTKTTTINGNQVSWTVEGITGMADLFIPGVTTPTDPLQTKDIIHDLTRTPSGPAILLITGCESATLAKRLQRDTFTTIVIGTDRDISPSSGVNAIKLFYNEIATQGTTIQQAVKNVNQNMPPEISLVTKLEPAQLVLYGKPEDAAKTLPQLLGQ